MVSEQDPLLIKVAGKIGVKIGKNLLSIPEGTMRETVMSFIAGFIEGMQGTET